MTVSNLMAPLSQSLLLMTVKLMKNIHSQKTMNFRMHISHSDKVTNGNNVQERLVV